MIEISPWKGFTRYLRNALNVAEGWEFTKPFFPVFSVDGMHWADELGIAEATAVIVAGAASSSIVLTVPANEAWLVLSATCHITQVAGGQAVPGQVRLVATMEGRFISLTEGITGTTRVGVQSIWTPPYPILFQSGDNLTGHLFNGHTADLNGFVRCLRRRLPSTSTP